MFQFVHVPEKVLLLLSTRFFLLAMLFFDPGSSEIQISQRLALPYLTKRCLKYYLGREQSFDKGFRVQFSIFSEIGFENWPISG